jgi:peptide/nickel transport system permease protein
MAITDANDDPAKETAAAVAPKTEKVLSPTAEFWRRSFSHAGFVIGFVVLVVIVLMAVLAPYISPHDPYDQDLTRKLIPPVWFDSPKATWEHPLGTDHARPRLSLAPALGRAHITC